MTWEGSANQLIRDHNGRSKPWEFRGGNVSLVDIVWSHVEEEEKQEKQWKNASFSYLEVNFNMDKVIRGTRDLYVSQTSCVMVIENP